MVLACLFQSPPHPRLASPPQRVAFWACWELLLQPCAGEKGAEEEETEARGVEEGIHAHEGGPI